MAKVPAIVVCSLLAFVLGAGAAVVGMTLFGSKLDGVRLNFSVDRRTNNSGGEPGKGPDMAAMMGKMGKGMGGKGKGKGGMGMGGMMGMGMMGKGPSPTKQLDDLVAKVDVLSSAPLKLDLTKEERKQLTDHVTGALKEEEFNDEAAKKHLDAILTILEPHKDTLVKAGYNWPGSGGGFGPPPDADTVKQHMASLQKRLNGATK